MTFRQKRLAIPAQDFRMFKKIFLEKYGVIWYSMWHWHIICVLLFTNLYFRIQRTSTIMTVLHGSNSPSKLFHPKLFGADRTLLTHRVLRVETTQRPFLLAVLSFRDNLCLDTTTRQERFLVTVCQLLHMQHYHQWVERTRVYFVEKDGVFFLNTLELQF